MVVDVPAGSTLAPVYRVRSSRLPGIAGRRIGSRMTWHRTASDS